MRVDGNLGQALTCLSMARNARRRSLIAPRGRLLQRLSAGRVGRVCRVRRVRRVRSGSLLERQDRNGVLVQSETDSSDTRRRFRDAVGAMAEPRLHAVQRAGGNKKSAHPSQVARRVSYRYRYVTRQGMPHHDPARARCGQHARSQRSCDEDEPLRHRWVSLGWVSVQIAGNNRR